MNPGAPNCGMSSALSHMVSGQNNSRCVFADVEVLEYPPNTDDSTGKIKITVTHGHPATTGGGFGVSFNSGPIIPDPLQGEGPFIFEGLKSGTYNILVTPIDDTALMGGSFDFTLDDGIQGCRGVQDAINYDDGATIDGDCVTFENELTAPGSIHLVSSETIDGTVVVIDENATPITADEAFIYNDLSGGTYTVTYTDTRGVTWNQEITIEDVLGCTDTTAANYDSSATKDDGSCEYVVPGCTDNNANNYNPLANTNDGSCTYDVYGCMNPKAENFDINANVDDGACYSSPLEPTLDVKHPTGGGSNDGYIHVTFDTTEEYSLELKDINGVVITESSAGEYNDLSEGTYTLNIIVSSNPLKSNDQQLILTDTSVVIPGCTIESATNFNPAATVDDDSCIYPTTGCTNPNATNYNPNATINDDSCVFPILGCMDSNADNYNADATEDDGNCTYTITGCMDSNASNYNADATEDDGSCKKNIMPMWLIITLITIGVLLIGGLIIQHVRN
jgi:hypothetical protein